VSRKGWRYSPKRP